MLNNFRKWLANRNFIKLKVIGSPNDYYCPLCLSDMEEKPEETTLTCSTCGLKLDKNIP
jgi:predicted amidophosphoribosyltransferase